MSKKALGILACALSAAFMSGTALAAGYNGNWPLTISKAQFYNGNYCLTLSGSTGGGATLNGQLGTLVGNFQVFGHDLIAIVPLPNSGGFNTGEEFVLRAAKGQLAKGTYVEDGDGEIDNSGVVTVGAKNGC